MYICAYLYIIPIPKTIKKPHPPHPPTIHACLNAEATKPTPLRGVSEGTKRSASSAGTTPSGQRPQVGSVGIPVFSHGILVG